MRIDWPAFRVVFALIVLALALAWYLWGAYHPDTGSQGSVCKAGGGYWTSLGGNLCVRTIGYPILATCLLYTDSGSISCVAGDIFTKAVP